MPRLIPRALALLGSLTLATACGDAATEPEVAGSYALARVNGAALPARFPIDAAPGTATATGGTLTMGPGRAWRAEVAALLDAGGAAVPASQVMAGTYTQRADTVFLRDARNGAVVPALVTGPTLVATVDGVRFEFRHD